MFWLGDDLEQLSIHRAEDFVSSNNSLVNLTLTPPRTKTYRLAYLSCDWKSVNAFNSTACLVDEFTSHRHPPHIKATPRGGVRLAAALENRW